MSNEVPLRRDIFFAQTRKFAIRNVSPYCDLKAVFKFFDHEQRTRFTIYSTSLPAF